MSENLFGDIIAAGHVAATRSATIFGVEVALVTNVKDPQQLGRVKVCFPRLDGGPESDWARVVQPAAGPGRGFYWLPEVGDEVLVAFEMGQANRPYVIRALWNAKDKPMQKAYDNDNTIRMIQTKSGHQIAFYDKQGDEKIVISDKTGKRVLTFDTKAKKLLIEADEGDVELHAKKKIVLHCEDLEVKTSKTAKLDVGQTFDLKIASDGAVKSGSTATLKGSKVQLNPTQLNVASLGSCNVCGGGASGAQQGASGGAAASSGSGSQAAGGAGGTAASGGGAGAGAPPPTTRTPPAPAVVPTQTIAPTPAPAAAPAAPAAAPAAPSAPPPSPATTPPAAPASPATVTATQSTTTGSSATPAPQPQQSPAPAAPSTTSPQSGPTAAQQPAAASGTPTPSSASSAASPQQQPPASANSAATPLYSAIDVAVITAHEGGNLRNGYVPAVNGIPIDDSGVTIGTGVDLGQQTSSRLLNMGVPQSVVARLNPYFGLQGAPAQAFLAAHPVTLSQADVDQLNSAVMSGYFNTTASNFNSANNSGFANFASLPGEAQTVIADLEYNLGELARSAPNFWNQVTNGRWNDAYQNLMNFTDQKKHPVLYQRAQQDAAILQRAIQNGTLPVPTP